MAKNFQIVKNFRGYRNKQDVTKLPPGTLIAGSQNVVLVDGERVSVRNGYSLDGAANANLNPIESSFEFLTSRGDEIPLRSYDDELEFRTDITGTVTWHRLADSFTAVDFQFTEYWDTTENMKLLLFVNGDDNMRMWSGGIATFASAAAGPNTITKQGTTTWAQEGFLANGTRSVIIEGTAYTYTGGEATTTLTGVLPDPTLAGHAVGAIVHQAVRTTANTPSAGVDNDLIATLNNQVWVASEDRNDVYVSVVNDYTDFTTIASPRIPGNAALFRLDGSVVGFIPQESQMYISAADDQWYNIELQLSADLVNESPVINRLKSGQREGARSQAMIARAKNHIVYISNEPTLDSLGRIENLDTPQSKPLSDPIKTDFDGYDFTNAHVVYHRNSFYIALPVESLVLIYNVEQGFWEPPQVLPIRRLAIIGGVLYGHSNAVPETYQLFTGTSDRSIAGASGNPIHAIANFSHISFGRRAWRKNLTEWFTEGYISSNTTLTRKLYYDFGAIQQDEDILGSNANIIFNFPADGSLGKVGLGKNPLGGGGEDVEMAKFRIKHHTAKNDFYEIRPQYESNGTDQSWEIIAMGGNVNLSTADHAQIKE